ncbi:hypothetical protein [Mesorhizobium sp.]|nr:hypothetical protein [Mesorhizobium sp.]
MQRENDQGGVFCRYNQSDWERLAMEVPAVVGMIISDLPRQIRILLGN